MRSGKHVNQAFTLTELLVILAIIAVLACIHVSALSLSKDQSRIAQCSANLHQIARSLQIYGGEYNDKLPTTPFSYSSWAWDMPWAIGTSLEGYGSTWQTLYCPGTAVRFGPEDDFKLYNFYTNLTHVVGYTLTLPGNSALATTNLNSSLTPQAITISGPLGNTTVPAMAPSKRVLLADATISGVLQYTYGARYTYNWTSISGGYPKPHLSPHLNGQFPAGGNLGMMDGHVEWRKFDDMQCRVSPSSSSPGFWW